MLRGELKPKDYIYSSEVLARIGEFPEVNKLRPAKTVQWKLIALLN